jgi:hypothetical protein
MLNKWYNFAGAILLDCSYSTREFSSTMRMLKSQEALTSKALSGALKVPRQAVPK